MLSVNGIGKRFGTFSLEGVGFCVEQGDYFMLLGPSGAGKSLLLEILAGLISPDTGRILLNGRDVTRSSIRERRFGLVFQDHASFPHLTVFDNIAYPLRRMGLSAQAIRKRVVLLAEMVAVAPLLRRFPHTLSGGEKQRMVLARTLALEPHLLLLDEPLSAVDVQLRSELRSLLREINRQGQTIVHVTHDYEEAISLAHHVAVVVNGRIEQQGTAKEVFQNPQSEFAARFTGARNFFPATLSREGGHGLFRASLTDSISVLCYADKPARTGYLCFPDDAVVVSTTCPEQSAVNVFRGSVVEVVAKRFGFEVVVDIGIRIHAHVTWESIVRLGIEPHKNLWVAFKANSVRFIPKV